MDGLQGREHRPIPFTDYTLGDVSVIGQRFCAVNGQFFLPRPPRPFYIVPVAQFLERVSLPLSGDAPALAVWINNQKELMYGRFAQEESVFRNALSGFIRTRPPKRENAPLVAYIRVAKTKSGLEDAFNAFSQAASQAAFSRWA